MTTFCPEAENELSVTRSIAALPIGRFTEPVQMMEQQLKLRVIQFLAQQARATAGLETGAEGIVTASPPEGHETIRRQTAWAPSIC
ncbi:hypothetical protein GTO89_12770 [Heliobacterium gestii]|uniref:Uncharacterized protein n=1 Tax=Heliomicrobium gestii TaxID=2699 RepID=A0A845LKI1_HELGE|nr:hypothetical protein [Heliomicrobium gestii]MBM7867549.1 hypothetical protein [Heliomicrobium gestii]MZP43903.1 hypothetical protein [Heliomicrobium gestii]